MPAALAAVLERFRALLAGAAGDRIVKPIELESADGARAWCFLVTADAAVARAVDGDDDGASIEDADSKAETGDPASVPEPEVATDVDTAGVPAPASEAVDHEAETAAPLALEHEVVTGDGATGEAETVSRDAAAAAPVDEAATRNPAPVPKARHRRAAKAEPTPQVQDGDPTPVKPAPVPTPPAPARSPAPAEVLDLFPEEVASLEPAAPSRPDAAALAAVVETRFGSRTTTWGEVATSFAGSDVAVEELKAALRHLRRGGRAVYNALRVAADEIDFPSNPVPPARVNRRTKAIDDGLFGSGE
jgi:hypothetical protein